MPNNGLSIDHDRTPGAGATLFSRPATTLAVTRGAQRLLRSTGRASVTEVSLPSSRRADLMGPPKSGAGADGCCVDFFEQREGAPVTDVGTGEDDFVGGGETHFDNGAF